MDNAALLEHLPLENGDFSNRYAADCWRVRIKSNDHHMGVSWGVHRQVAAKVGQFTDSPRCRKCWQGINIYVDRWYPATCAIIRLDVKWGMEVLTISLSLSLCRYLAILTVHEASELRIPESSSKWNDYWWWFSHCMSLLNLLMIWWFHHYTATTFEGLISLLH